MSYAWAVRLAIRAIIDLSGSNFEYLCDSDDSVSLELPLYCTCGNFYGSDEKWTLCIKINIRSDDRCSCQSQRSKITIYQVYLRFTVGRVSL